MKKKQGITGFYSWMIDEYLSFYCLSFCYTLYFLLHIVSFDNHLFSIIRVLLAFPFMQIC